MAIKKILDENALGAIKTYVDANGVHSLMNASSVAGASSSPYKSVRWYVSGVDGVTAPYDGMKVAIKIPRAGVSTAGVVLSINGDTDADYHPVALNLNSVLTSHFPVGTVKMFTYDATATMACYISSSSTATTVTGVWKCDANYDTNTTTTYGTLEYYFRPYAAERLSRYKLVALDKDNRIIPITKELYTGDYSTSTTYAIGDIVKSGSDYYRSKVNSNKNNAVTNTSYWEAYTMPTKFTPNTTAFKPEKIWFYNTTATIAAGGVLGGQSLTAIGYNTSILSYTFWQSVPAYRVIYLAGTYNKTTGLFTLDSSTYFVLVPDNTADINLSSYFTSGKDYILVGATYSSANYLQLFMNNPMFHFDGTNLISWSAWSSSTSDTNYYHTPTYSSGLKIGTGTGVADLYVPETNGTNQSGVVSLGAQTFGGVKTFTSTPVVSMGSGSDTSAGITFSGYSGDSASVTLRKETASSGTFIVTLPAKTGKILLRGETSLDTQDTSGTGMVAYISSVSGGGATGSGTTKYLHFSAGSVPSRSQFTYATGSFSTAASMNYNTGTTTDNKYVYEISSTGASASGTATFVKTISGGSGSLTSQDNGGGGAIAYIASASHTPASLGDPDTGTVTISGGSYSGTTRYMKVTPTSADTSSVGISGGSGTFYGTRSTSGSGTSARRTLTLSHSHTGASLTGTTTFATNGIKSVSLSESTTSTDGPAYTKSISGSAPSLGGTKTFVTGYPDFSGGSASHTTKYMLHTHTGASVATSGDAVTGVTGGTTSATYRYMKFTAPVLSTTQAYQITGVGSVPSLESNTTASGGITYLQDYTTTGTAASGTTKYMKIKEKED